MAWRNVWTTSRGRAIVYAISAVLAVFISYGAGVSHFHRVNCSQGDVGDCDLGFFDGLIWAFAALGVSVVVAGILESLIRRQAGSRPFNSTGSAFTLSQVATVHDPGADWYPMPGGKVMFMWDEAVDIPFWTHDGLLPQDPEWLRVKLGLSEPLIADILQWCQDMQAAYTYEREVTPAESEARGRSEDLVARVRTELDGRFNVVLGPGEYDEAGD